MNLHRGFAAEGAKAAGGIVNIGLAYHPGQPAAQPLKRPFGRRKVPDRGDRPGADHDFRLTVDDRPDQLRDVVGAVLIVGVRIHDHIRPGIQRSFEAGHKGAGKATMPSQTNDVVNAVRSRHLGGAVAAPVIDHQPFDEVDTRDLPGQRRQRHRQRGLLVIAGDLDDQFHACSLVGSGLPRQHGAAARPPTGYWPGWEGSLQRCVRASADSMAGSRSLGAARVLHFARPGAILVPASPAY